MDLVENIYRLTAGFPNDERYGLTSQLRRSVTSIALNIAEGSGCPSEVEFARFLDIAQRSNYELMCGIEIAQRLSFLSVENRDQILDQSDEVSAMIFGLKKKLKADR